MENLKKLQNELNRINDLIIHIGENINSVKAGINSKDFEKSKESINETIELIEKHLAGLKEKINKSQEEKKCIV